MAHPKLLLATEGGRGGLGKKKTAPGCKLLLGPSAHGSGTGEVGCGAASGKLRKWWRSQLRPSPMTWLLGSSQ
eukprot:7459935-Prorocentrum_lima.AAC.1